MCVGLGHTKESPKGMGGALSHSGTCLQSAPGHSVCVGRHLCTHAFLAAFGPTGGLVFHTGSLACVPHWQLRILVELSFPPKPYLVHGWGMLKALTMQGHRVLCTTSRGACGANALAHSCDGGAGYAMRF
eukprot:9960848-Alexandrium_andersonii.AAC.1